MKILRFQPGKDELEAESVIDNNNRHFCYPISVQLPKQTIDNWLVAALHILTGTVLVPFFPPYPGLILIVCLIVSFRFWLDCRNTINQYQNLIGIQPGYWVLQTKEGKRSVITLSRLVILGPVGLLSIKRYGTNHSFLIRERDQPTDQWHKLRLIALYDVT